MTRIKTSALVGAVALALVLAGCGGSSSQRATPAAALVKTDLESAMEALAAAKAMALLPVITADSDLAALDAHQKAQTEVVKAADALLVLLKADPNTPHTDVDAARAAKAGATTAMEPVVLRIAALMEAATARQTAVTDAGKALKDALEKVEAISATSTVAELKAHNAAQVAVKGAADALAAALEAEPTSEAADITAAEEAATTAGAAAMAAMVRIVTADSVALAMAIMVNANDNATKVVAAPFHSTTTVDNYAVAVARKSAARAEVTVTDRNDDKELGAGDAPPAIKGWLGAGFKRDTESVSVYSDIAAPTPIPFFALAGNRGKYEGSKTLKIDDITKLALWKSPELKVSPKGLLKTTYEEDTAFRGTFDGASGEFKCFDNSCTLTTNSKGVATSSSGGSWYFTPDKGAMVDKLDADHLHFGYWLRTTPNDDGTSSYAFQAFSSGNLPFGATKTAGTEAARMATVYGSAEYAGAAGGLYVQKALNTDGTLNTATDGMFTAKANLTAHFDGGIKVAVADQFSISGMVEKFMDGGTDLGWTVKLMRADFATRTSTGVINDYTNKFNGMTEGSAGLDNGQWRGMFYGSSIDAEDSKGVAIIPGLQPQPTGVSGQFNAYFTNGHVHGGFGATRTP